MVKDDQGEPCSPIQPFEFHCKRHESVSKLAKPNMRIQFSLLICLTLAIGCQSRDESTNPLASSKAVSKDKAEVRPPLEPTTLSLIDTFPNAAGACEKVNKEIKVPGIGIVRCSAMFCAGENPKQKVPLIIALHYGYTGRRPAPFTGGTMFPLYEDAFQKSGCVVIAPDVLYGDWLLADNEDTVLWLARSAAMTYPIDESRIVVSGFSMGGRGSWYYAARHGDFFTGAIPIAAPSTEETDVDIPAYAIHSLRDSVVSIEEAKRHVEAVRANQGLVEFQEVTDLKHYDTFEYGKYLPDALKWLEQQWSTQD